MKQASFLQSVIVTLLTTMTILHTTKASAQLYMGKITLEVGEEYVVSAVPTSGYTASGSFSKSGTNFVITANGSYYCKIRANYVGKGTLSYWGSVARSGSWTTDIYDLYWDVEVKAAPVKVTSISLSNSSVSLPIGKEKQLTATVLPSNATNKSVTWSSSDTGVATVDNNGQVTAVGEGTATVTCKAQDGSNCKATCTINVGDFPDSDEELIEPDGDWSEYGNYSIDWYISNKNQTEYTLTTNKELAGVAYLVNNGYYDFKGVNIKLGADIDLNGKYWRPIGYRDKPFKGSFDGQGHTIKGIYIRFTNDLLYYGFFGYILGESSKSTSSVKNATFNGIVNVTNAIYSGNPISTSCIGGIAGYCGYTIIDSCTCNMPINFRIEDCYHFCRIGGIAGAFSSGKINYCKHNGNISLEENRYSEDKQYIGGITGSSSTSEINYSENFSDVIKYVANAGTGSIDHENFIGTISGSSNGTISFCRSIVNEIYVSNNFSYNSDWTYNINAVSGTNSYSSISKIISESPKAWDILNLESSGRASFVNSDLVIKGWDKKTESYGTVSTAFTSEQMQTRAFLSELNMYSSLEMDGPVWKQDEGGGFPYIAKLYEGVGVRPVLQDKMVGNHHYYSLTGQRLNAPQKGINIVGGKKVIVR